MRVCGVRCSSVIFLGGRITEFANYSHFTAVLRHYWQDSRLPLAEAYLEATKALTGMATMLLIIYVDENRRTVIGSISASLQEYDGSLARR